MVLCGNTFNYLVGGKIVKRRQLLLMGAATRNALKEAKAGQKVKQAVANAKAKRNSRRKLKTRRKRQPQNK
jgi:hypothetical protein